MKGYTIPAVVLLAASGLLALGTLKSFSSAHQASSERQAAVDRVASDRTQLTSLQKTARQTAEKSAEADQFLDKWNAELDAESNIEEILGRLDTLAVNSLLSPAGKNFRLNGNYPFDGKRLAVQTVNIAVTGDFYRTLNWLGAAEHDFPLARVEQISYTNTGNVLSLAVQFSFPRQFDVQ